MKKKMVMAAPIQGWTDHVWRNAHAQIFGGVDAYVAPFMRVEHGRIRPRDLRDISPDINIAVPLLPQVLACRADDMSRMLEAITNLGYTAVSVNLGCPHPPVARKGYGAGMLARPEQLRALMVTLAQFPTLTYSLKMRLGWDNIDQWKNVLPLLGHVPISCLVMHYRLGVQQYKGEALLEHIDDTIAATDLPVVINGDITSSQQLCQLLDRHPGVAGAMVGRALVQDPALLVPDKATVANYRLFHHLLYEQYSSELTGGDHQILSKMQSLWERMLLHLGANRTRKAIRKATSLTRYEVAVEQLFDEAETLAPE